MKKIRVKIQKAVSYAFEENAYLIHFDTNKECVVIDPGIEPDNLLGILHEEELQPVAILVTHGHFDHIGGIAAVREIWPDCKIWTSEQEAKKLLDPILNLSATFGFPRTTPPADRILQDGEEFTVAGLSFQAMQIPGHSCGHLVFVLKDMEPLNVFVGDTIFGGSIGRGDFPDGDSNLLIETIKTRLFTLPGETILYPGHGGKTTVAREKRSNPFLQ